MNAPLITVERLTKRFGRITVLKDIAFSVQAGESVALWGSNGAGKTTLLRCMLGILPFDGEVAIQGLRIPEESKEARRLIGFVPQEVAFYDTLNVWETLQFFARLRRQPQDQLASLLEQIDLQEHAHKKVGALSGGMRQRLALGIALLGNPPILFLDEPTLNLDIRSRDTFIHWLLELREQGKTLVFSSHRLEEIHLLADRVLVLDQGRLVAEETPEMLTLRLEGPLSRKRFMYLCVPEQESEKACTLLRQEGFTVNPNGHGLRIEIAEEDTIAPLKTLITSGITILDFELLRGS